MKLWLLSWREDLPESGPGNPWALQYDKAYGFVVRANTEQQAREFADHESGNETDSEHNPRNRHPWLDPAYSTCEELVAEGPPGVVIRDFHHG